MKKKDEKQGKNFGSLKIMSTFAIPKRNNGVIAQLVEQRTENPCVPGSIPGDTTKRVAEMQLFFIFVGKQNIKILPASMRFCMIIIKIVAFSPNQLPLCSIRIFFGHSPVIA